MFVKQLVPQSSTRTMVWAKKREDAPVGNFTTHHPSKSKNHAIGTAAKEVKFNWKSVECYWKWEEQQRNFSPERKKNKRGWCEMIWWHEKERDGILRKELSYADLNQKMTRYK